MRMHEFFLVGLVGIGVSLAPPASADGPARLGPEEAKSPKRDERPQPPPPPPGEARRPDGRDHGRPEERGGPDEKVRRGEKPNERDRHPGNPDDKGRKRWGERGPRTPPPEVKSGRDELEKTREERAKQRRAEMRKQYGNEVARKEVREEIETHEKRLAYLGYLKQTAQTRGDTASVTRANALITKENARHKKAMQALTGGNR